MVQKLLTGNQETGMSQANKLLHLPSLMDCAQAQFLWKLLTQPSAEELYLFTAHPSWAVAMIIMYLLVIHPLLPYVTSISPQCQ